MSLKQQSNNQSTGSMSSTATSKTVSSTSTKTASNATMSTATVGMGGVVTGMSVYNGKAKSSSSSSSSRRGELPRLFYYMETGQWDAAMERLRRNPKEAKIWATLRTKSMSMTTPISPPTTAAAEQDKSGTSKVSGTKRLALHHACFKLRSAGAAAAAAAASGSHHHLSPSSIVHTSEQDPFAQVCRFILALIQIYPDAAGQRESRHGCLPLHLAAFASCAPRPVTVVDPRDGHVGGNSNGDNTNRNAAGHYNHNRSQSAGATVTPNTATTTKTSPTHTSATSNGSSSGAKANVGAGVNLARPQIISRRTASNDTTNTMDTAHTNMSAVHAEETYTGGMTSSNNATNEHSPGGTPKRRVMTIDPNVSVAMRTVPANVFHPTTHAQQLQISLKREEMAVHVLNALLDAYPKAVRVDSEGGRLPLHTACAGRATPRVISTLVTAYPSAARHRNKDGFLPLHLAAHWGVSHPDVAVQLLKTYPDATVGRNRWERTPLEEALCMAGENGRPHQALLVRALRKHPSYWSRPPSELFRLRHRNVNPKNTIVDTDESLPSSDSTTLEEQMRNFDLEALMEGIDQQGMGLPPSSGGIISRLTSTSNGKERKGKTEEDLAVGIKLSTLIQNQKWSSVLARLEINPHEAEEELQEMTRGGFFATTGMAPLHYACERRPPVEVVQALLELNGMAVMTRTMPGGCLPLHVACTWFASPDVVRALISADPGSAQVADELGNLALHSACFSGADIDVVESLVGASMASVLARNHQGSRPIDICKRLRHDNRRKVMALLTLKKEEVMAEQRRRGRSSGNCADIANEALRLNEHDGLHTENGYDHVPEEAVGVEVSYPNAPHEAEELVWI